VKLFFVRGATDYFAPGSLWISDLDGSDASPLIEEAAVVDVLDVVTHWQSGNPTVYYHTSEVTSEATATEGRRGRDTVSSLDIVTGERAQVLTFETWGGQLEGAADITADGRYLAYTDISGVAVLDTANGETRRLLGGEPRTLCQGDIYQCSSYGRPIWSSDGSSLVVFLGGYEGGHPVVLNVFAEILAPVELESSVPEQWSPSGLSLCVVDRGDYDHGIGAIIAKAPDWRAQKFLSDYLTSVPGGTIIGFNSLVHCVWLDESRVALVYGNFVHPQGTVRELLILDTDTGDLTVLPEHSEFTSSRGLLAIPDRILLISQFHHAPGYPDPIGDALTPEVVDADTGARRAILTTEDWVVAAVPADMLAR